MFKSRRKHAAKDPEYLRPYAEAARKVGARFEALLWQNPDGQRRRFDVIADMVQPEHRSIADLGCGRVDLLVHLHQIERAPRSYLGVDGIRAMVEAGQREIDTHSFHNARIIEGDFVADPALFDEIVRTHAVDVLIFSGSLNTLEQPSAEAVLDRAFAALKPGQMLVFNFLSDLIPGGGSPETGPAFRFSTLGMLSWALARTPLVQFRHDYLNGHDATILMRVPDRLPAE